MKNGLKKGLFITFEGPEGSGKSTHAERIYKFLKKEGYDCVFTREPGGTLVGDKIRDILLNPRYKNENISSLTELFLFEASRSHLIQEVILPSLENRKIVIADRFSDSTIVYQGYTGSLPLCDVLKADMIVTKSVRPDLTILLDVDAETGLNRAAKFRNKDRMESKSLDFHRRVRNGYLDIAKKYRNRIRLIRAEGSIAETQEAVRDEVIKLVKRFTT